MRQLTEAQIGDVPDEGKAQLTAMLDEQVKQVTEACTAGNWPE